MKQTIGLNKESPDRRAVSKLRAVITIQNLADGSEAFTGDFICYDGELEIITKEEPHEFRGVQFSTREVGLTLRFKDLQHGAKLHFTTAPAR